MRPIIVPGLLITASMALAEPGFHQYEVAGYDNTPLVPGSPWKVHDHDRPQPPRVPPGEYVEQDVPAAPADAEILFDGSSLEQFLTSKWTLKGGYVVAGEGSLTSRKAYGDCQLHVEWRVPNPSLASEKPSNMGNSGIYFMWRYEVQVFDSYSCRIYPDGSAAAVYGQTPPLANVCRKPGEWQIYDIVFTAPEFEGKGLLKPARLTVLHNGVVVHNNTEILGTTAHKKEQVYDPHAPRLPIAFQGHKSPVEYRNIWIRDLERQNH